MKLTDDQKQNIRIAFWVTIALANISYLIWG